MSVIAAVVSADGDGALMCFDVEVALKLGLISPQHRTAAAIIILICIINSAYLSVGFRLVRISFFRNDFRNINNLLNLALVLDITYRVAGFFISPLICCSLKL